MSAPGKKSTNDSSEKSSPKFLDSANPEVQQSLMPNSQQTGNHNKPAEPPAKTLTSVPDSKVHAGPSTTTREKKPARTSVHGSISENKTAKINARKSLTESKPTRTDTRESLVENKPTGSSAVTRGNFPKNKPAGPPIPDQKVTALPSDPSAHKPTLADILGPTVKNKEGNDVSTQSLAEENYVIGLYFAASWCPPCQHLTVQLRALYESLQCQEKLFQVVYVSFDQNLDSFTGYYAKMPWLAIDFHDLDKRIEIAEFFGIRRIPVLVLLEANTCEVITLNGREVVALDPLGAKFPWKLEDMVQTIMDLTVPEAKTTPSPHLQASQTPKAVSPQPEPDAGNLSQPEGVVQTEPEVPTVPTEQKGSRDMAADSS